MKRLWSSCALIFVMGCNLSDPVGPFQEPIVIINNTTSMQTNNNTTSMQTNNVNVVTGDALQVLQTVPASGATAVALDSFIEIIFSGVIDDTAGDIELTDSDGNPVDVDIELDGVKTTLTPTAPLAADGEYTVTIGTMVADVDGQRLEEPHLWSFETVASLRIVSIAPADRAVEVQIRNPIVITMSAPVDATSVSNDSIEVIADTWVENEFRPVVPGTVEVEGAVLTFWPIGDEWQEYETGYEVTLGPIRGEAGEVGEGFARSTFRTIFWDPAYLYGFRTERTDTQTALTIDSAGVSLMARTLDDTARWYFDHIQVPGAEGYWYARNVQDANTRWLESADGNGAAFMTAPAPPPNIFSGQAWRPIYVASREVGSVQRRGDSPGVYHLESLFQGEDRSLRASPDAQGIERAFMQAKTNAPEQLWWFERLGPQ